MTETAAPPHLGKQTPPPRNKPHHCSVICKFDECFAEIGVIIRTQHTEHTALWGSSAHANISVYLNVRAMTKKNKKRCFLIYGLLANCNNQST